MGNIFGVRYPFKILCSVICANAIFVIDDQAFFEPRAKG
ncbi:hypothetical protein SAMN05216178_4002 [Pseudomonas saponiphila]|uniref:Uncharacterized protein n=1 Tax=Pseudomonas saponiphila TaxID=556534 RepID=A0A1H4R1J5_9PSED|nr:hypothetical protein SAMN05216178_4002 [Pseudomonas saponiphila]